MDLNKIQSLILVQQLRETAKTSFYEFVKQAWPFVEGLAVPFVDGWHIQAVCEHVEAVIRLQIENLLINIPPRTGKSSIISVMLPAWVWITFPNMRFLYSSYSLDLSKRDSVKCRELIESPWYQAAWGDIYTLTNANVFKISNSTKGYRIATSVNSKATGEGGDILVSDDPNNAKDGESESKRERAINWWSGTWSTRINNPKKKMRIVVQQRLDQRDISGYIIDNDSDDEWTKLILPIKT